MHVYRVWATVCLPHCAEIEQNLREKYQQLRDLIHHLEVNRGASAVRNGRGMPMPVWLQVDRMKMHMWVWQLGVVSQCVQTNG